MMKYNLLLNVVLTTIVLSLGVSYPKISPFQWELVQNGLTRIPSTTIISPESVVNYVNFVIRAISKGKVPRHLMDQLFSSFPNQVDHTKSFGKLKVLAEEYTKNNYKEINTLNFFSHPADLIKEPANLTDYDKFIEALFMNAIEFKWSWAIPFAYFFKGELGWSNGEKFKSIYMKAKGNFSYHKSETLNATIVKLPLERNYAMFKVMPNGDESLDEFIKRIDHNKVESLLSSMAMTEATVYLPIIKIDLNANIAGIMTKSIYDQFLIDESVKPDYNFTLPIITQKATITLEEGGISGNVGTHNNVTAVEPPTAEMIFRANRNFIFFIMNVWSKNIFFAGKVVYPDFI